MAMFPVDLKEFLLSRYRQPSKTPMMSLIYSGTCAAEVIDLAFTLRISVENRTREI
jgi:hypothetical protein